MVFVSIFKGMNRTTLKYAIHNQLPTSLDDEAAERHYTNKEYFNRCHNVWFLNTSDLTTTALLNFGLMGYNIK